MAAKEKTIVSPVTLVLKKGEDPTPAGTEVTLPADVADDLINRFGAVEVEEAETKVKKAKDSAPEPQA